MARSDSVHILVVDDDRLIQRLLADALSKKGYSVTVERDGEWALRTFQKKRFDLVILDLLLPALNGYEVARKIRGLPRGRRIPIIMISGVYKNAANRKEATVKYGASDFLEKPFKLDELFDSVERALDHKVPRPKPAQPPPPPIEEDEVTGEFLADEAQRKERDLVEQQAKQVLVPVAGPSIRGSLRTRPFAELVAELYRWRATGALLLKRNKVKKIVYFRGGNPQLVKSNLLVECLGQVLVREKMISEAECAESLRRMKATRRMQGTALIEMGCISPHNLQYALTLQLQHKLLDAFRWDEGEYQFNPKVAPPPEPLGLAMTTAQLIHEGVTRAYDQKRLDRVLAGLDEKYVHASGEPLYALQDAGLSDDEQELMRLINGHKKVSTLRRLEILPRLDTDRMLFSLKCAQLIELRDEPAVGRPKLSIARIAETEIDSERTLLEVPPPLPVGPPSRPPPLPLRAPDLPPLAGRPPAKPPLGLPWEDAALAHPMAPAMLPPRPPPPTPRPARPPRAEPIEPEPAPPRRTGSLMPELSMVMSLPSISSEDAVERERLAAKAGALRRLDYFEILGVRRDATREDIKRRYFGLAKEYHPDKHYQSASAEVRQLAQQIYDLISAAHDTLTDPAERDRYLQDLERGVKRDLGEDVGKILAAEGKFQRGEELMRQRLYADAYRQFQDAIDLYGDEGEFHAWLGWALFLGDPRQSDGAIARIDHAVSLNPKLDRSYLFLGYIHKATGRPDKAERQFEKALQCNPDCTEALRELRLLGRLRK